MATLADIRVNEYILSKTKMELAQAKERLNALANEVHDGETPVGYEPAREEVFRLLKGIADLNQTISIQYLSLAADAESAYEEENLISWAAQYAKNALEAEIESKHYTPPESS